MSTATLLSQYQLEYDQISIHLGMDWVRFELFSVMVPENIGLGTDGQSDDIRHVLPM